jgi:hypothetical protein
LSSLDNLNQKNIKTSSDVNKLIDTPKNILDITTTNSPLDVVGQQLLLDPDKFRVSLTDPVPKKQDTLPKETVNKIINVFADQHNVNVGLATVAIAALVQAGGTNASMPPLVRTVNGRKFELKILRDIIKLYTNNKGTVRQLAKSMRDTIYQISALNEWPGSLAIALKKEYPSQNFSMEDLAAANEFNEDNFESYMPAHVREALVDRAQKMKAARMALSPKKKKRKFLDLNQNFKVLKQKVFK